MDDVRGRGKGEGISSTDRVELWGTSVAGVVLPLFECPWAAGATMPLPVVVPPAAGVGGGEVPNLLRSFLVT